MTIYDFLQVKKEEPIIVVLNEPIKMIGVSVHTNEKSIFRDADRLGKQYNQIKKAGLIKNKREPWEFVAVSKGFTDDGSWDYLNGDVVTSFDSVPDGLTAFEIPVGRYARFHFQPRSVLVWGIGMGLLKKYIYTEWLPSSPYEPDNAVVGDFEYHDERSKARKPGIDLYMAIKEK